VSRKREKLGWCIYDWANSAFATTILAAVLPIYFAEGIVPEEGVRLSFLGYAGSLSATSLWGYINGFSAILIVGSAPILGGIADYTSRKKLFLIISCYAGSLFTCLMFFCKAGAVFYTLLLFCLAHYCFVGGNVFYDSFLPFLSKDDEMDRLSGHGYALGYLGGGLVLAMNMAFIQLSHKIGVPKDMAIRLSMASVGVWWAMFGTISFLMFHEDRFPATDHIGMREAAVAGLHRAWQTTKTLNRHKHVMTFLLAYMIYNDGVQTVIKMASIYGKDELHLSTGILLGTLLMIQFVGIGGTILMSRIARQFGTKRTIMATLMIWFGVTLFAYRMSSSLEYLLLGLIVGLVLGGTQALSRSLYGRLVPKERSAEFFGYFSVFAKLSAIWGPILFAFIRQITGTSRLSILSLSLFFLTGCLLLFLVRETKQ